VYAAAVRSISRVECEGECETELEGLWVSPEEREERLL
jgi:acyl-CoA synthetase (AMP-forming)/AMP-acid ligase II